MEDQILRTVNGILKPVSVKQISAMQLKKCMRKDFKLYAFRATDLPLNENQTSINEHHVLGDFLDLFPEEILGLPLNEKLISPLRSCPNLHQYKKYPTK